RRSTRLRNLTRQVRAVSSGVGVQQPLPPGVGGKVRGIVTTHLRPFAFLVARGRPLSSREERKKTGRGYRGWLLGVSPVIPLLVCGSACPPPFRSAQRRAAVHQ